MSAGFQRNGAFPAPHPFWDEGGAQARMVKFEGGAQARMAHVSAAAQAMLKAGRRARAATRAAVGRRST